MTPRGDWHEDMERIALDPDAAERLLSGGLEPEDAPHRFGEVASLLRIAAGPASGALDNEATAVPAVVEAIRSSRIAPTPAPRRPARRIRLRAATAGVVGALTLTGSLAAADALPAPAQKVAADALAAVGLHVPDASSGPQTGPRPPATEPAGTAGPGVIAATTTPTSALGPETTSATSTTATAPASAGSSTATVTAPGQAGAHAGRQQTTTAPSSPAPRAAPAAPQSPGGSGDQPAAAAPASPSSPDQQSAKPTAGPQAGAPGKGRPRRADPSRGSPKGPGATHRATPARGA
jgi:hypothetical protein